MNSQRLKQARKQNTMINFVGSETVRLGGGPPLECEGVEKLLPFLKAQENKFVLLDIHRFCRDVWKRLGVFKKFLRNQVVLIFRTLTFCSLKSLRSSSQ